jgi:hypothetical protein
MEKLWPGCINGAVSHHSARGLTWALKARGTTCPARRRRCYDAGLGQLISGGPGTRQWENGWSRKAGGQLSIGVASMCDYSLRHVASRPARAGDKLVSTSFVNSGTRGFAAVGEPNVAVCLLPGTELAFEEIFNAKQPMASVSNGSRTRWPGFGRWIRTSRASTMTRSNCRMARSSS